jgi:hypothetical protein
MNMQFIVIDKLQEKPVIHHKNSRRHKQNINDELYNETEIVWHLYKYIGPLDNSFQFSMHMPSEQLNPVLINEYIAKDLNTGLLFTFEYTPGEGDNLYIEREYVRVETRNKLRQGTWGYLSFIYKEGKWKADVYIDNHNKELIKSGIVQADQIR